VGGGSGENQCESVTLGLLLRDFVQESVQNHSNLGGPEEMDDQLHLRTAGRGISCAWTGIWIGVLNWLLLYWLEDLYARMN